VFEGMREKLGSQGSYQLVVKPKDRTWFYHAVNGSPEEANLAYTFTVGGAPPSRLQAEWRLPEDTALPSVRMGMPAGGLWSVPELTLRLLDSSGKAWSVEGFTKEQLKGMLELKLDHATIRLRSGGVEVEVRARACAQRAGGCLACLWPGLGRRRDALQARPTARHIK
jgi:hypothetical protein